MKDLVERLHEKADEVQTARSAGSEDLIELLEEAANKINELQAINEI